jgi:hypothetical protein
LGGVGGRDGGLLMRSVKVDLTGYREKWGILL